MSDPDSPFPFRRDEFETEGPLLPAAVLYWVLVAVVAFVGAGLCAITNGSNFLDSLLVGGLLMVLVLPAVQLGASVLAVLAVLLFYSEKTLALQRIGTITLWAFAGSMIGMALLGVGLGGLFLLR
jgi:heme/copper-type cytochrome/quinol oxidase subunit 1